MGRTAIRLGVALSGVLVVATGTAAAHVDYVTDSGNNGSVTELIGTVLSSPTSVVPLVVGTLGAVVLVAGYLRFASAIPDIQIARATLQSYRPYLPWMLRLAVGLPLVGAGFAGYLFTPAAPVSARLLQVTIGFLLLFGLATRLVAAAGLVTYLVTLISMGTPLLLASEYVAGFLGILAVGPGQPSADMMLRRMAVTDGTVISHFQSLTTPKELLARLGYRPSAAPVVLRVFLGLNFLYLGVAQKLLQPGEAVAVVVMYDLTAVVPVTPELWVFGAGVTEAAVGLTLVAGAFTRGAATVGFLMLTTTLFGLPDDPVLAHITLFGLTSALMVTGAGRYSLDAAVLPALRERVDLRRGPPASTPSE